MSDQSPPPAIGRRTLLQSLAAGLTAGAPLHDHIPKPTAPFAAGAPSYFSPAQYKQLSVVCQLIIPADGQTGGAIEAGVPAFIDLLTSENKDYQRRLSGGLLWLDAFCSGRFERTFVECSSLQQKEVLDMIAFRSGAEPITTAAIMAGIEFFAFLRDLTLDGFFTSKIGIEYLDFQGNGALVNFSGCPASSVE